MCSHDLEPLHEAVSWAPERGRLVPSLFAALSSALPFPHTLQDVWLFTGAQLRAVDQWSSAPSVGLVIHERTQSPPCSLSTGPGVETSVQIGIPLLLSPSRVQLFATLWTVRLVCPWDCPGKNTGEGCHFLLQGIFPDQESNLLLAGGFFTTEPRGKPNRDPTGVKLMCDIRDAPQVNPRDLFLYCFEYQGGCCCPFFCRAIYANDFFHAKLFKCLFPYPVDVLYPSHLRKNIRK